MQARTSRIMRLPQPHDPDGRPCLPTHHPRSQPRSPTSPTPTRQLQDAEAPHLLAYLASVPDPRAARGRRHPLVAILAWPPPRCWPAPGRSPRSPSGPPTRPSRSGPRSAPAATPPATSPSRPRPPSAGPLPAWTPTPWPARSAPGWPTGSGPSPAASRRRAVAVDGKTLRGARAAGGDGRPVHLLAAMDHTSRAVLAQRQVGGAPEEVPAFAPLLAALDLAGVVVTADALQTHPEAAEFLVTSKQAHYLFMVKANQPTLLDRCAAPALAHVPGAGPHPRPRPRPHRAPHPQGRHGPPVRVPPRRPGHPGHPQDPRPAHPAVADRDRLRDHQPPLRPGQPRPPGRPAARPLGDRGAAPRPRHHLRRGRLPGPHRRRPHVMAALRNLVIGVLSRAGPVNLAAALRHHARDPRRPLATLGISLG